MSKLLKTDTCQNILNFVLKQFSQIRRASSWIHISNIIFIHSEKVIEHLRRSRQKIPYKNKLMIHFSFLNYIKLKANTMNDLD